MEDFYKKLAEILEEEMIQEEDKLKDFEEWDSLGVLSTIAMIDTNYGVTITSEEISKLVNVGDLVCLINSKKGK